MNRESFDEFSRRLGQSGSRRQVLRVLAGGVTAALFGGISARRVEAGVPCAPGAPCQTSQQCSCGMTCTNHRCSLSNGNPCNSNTDCVSQVCSGASHVCCSGDLAGCRTNQDCCNGNCVNGICKTCSGVGATCRVSSECCSGACTGGYCVCPRGQVLINGFCAQVCTPGVTSCCGFCAQDKEGQYVCGTGGTISGRTCNTSADCVLGEACSHPGGDGFCFALCCPDGQVFVNGACVRTCTSSSECCAGGFCVPNKENQMICGTPSGSSALCNHSSDCPPGQACSHPGGQGFCFAYC